MSRNFEFRINGLLIITVIIIASCICEETNPVSRKEAPLPKADFYLFHVDGFDDISEPWPGEYVSNYFRVIFRDSSEHAEESLWTFGDGTQSTARNPEHVYSDTGTYSVVLTVKNEHGIDWKEKKVRCTGKY